MACESESEVANFYANRSVLVTGATGFLGKVLIEKLLRSIPRLKSIYVLIRPCKGQSAQERWKKVMQADLFDSIRKSIDETDGGSILDKVIVVESDLMEPELGLTNEDAKRICDDVSVVFHCAATVKFDEHLRIAVKMNIQGTQRLLRLSDKMKRLDAFVHVSTAFCNCDRTYVLERVYPAPIPPQRLIEACEWMNDDMLDSLTPYLVGRRPNTYTMTKALTESLLVEESNHLPITIVRPSIVSSPWKEPIPGWVDNYNGITGLAALTIKGLVRVLYGRVHEINADIVPVDLAVNMIIVAGWHRGMGKGSPMPVIQVSSDRLNPVTWGQIVDWGEECVRERFPLAQLFREPGGRFTESYLEYNIRLWYDHLIPAYILDGILYTLGYRPIMLRIYNKVFRAMDTMMYFYSNRWEHQTKMMLDLNEQLSDEDKKRFFIDVRQINWKEYCEDFYIGIRKYILKEDISTAAEGFRVRYRRRVLYNAFRIGLWAFIFRFFIRKTKIGATVWALVIRLLSGIGSKMSLK